MRERCRWCNTNNSLYVEYHDKEWGVLRTDDAYLFEMLILEAFQAGLSWECVLNKREAFKRAYDDFDLEKVCNYDEAKLEELKNNPGIIRNGLKISASVKNARVFKEIKAEFGSFYAYLCEFSKGRIIYENNAVTSTLSDAIAKDLKKRGMSFMGSTTVYAYLQAVGIINSHADGCFCNKKMLRKKIKEKQSALDSDYYEAAGKKICESVVKSEVFKEAQTIFTYIAAPGEPKTALIIERALSMGKTVCVPRCISRHEMEAVKITSFRELEVGAYGLLEPVQGLEIIEPQQIELAIVPCVSASKQGARLGHGAGYYDNFLKGQRTIKTLCLCFEELICEDIPMFGDDLYMDAVVTEKSEIGKEY